MMTRGVRLPQVSRRYGRFVRAYLQAGLSPALDCRPLTPRLDWRPLTPRLDCRPLTPRLDCRPPTRLDRPSPALLFLPSSVSPSLLVVRAGVETGVARLDADVVRGLGVGKRLVRRLFIALTGRAVRRAIGLSSVGGLLSSSAIVTRRLEPGVPVDGDEYAKVGLFSGVAGACSALATGRLIEDLAGVAVAEWMDGGGESIEERPRGLLTGIDDCPETLLNGVAEAGLWWCPTMVSRMLVLAFHRGLFAGRSVAGVDERVVLVGVLAIVRAMVGSRYVECNDLRVVLPGMTGKLEYRRFGGADDFVVEVLD